jgi:threonyl-tRNA synthetase
MEKNLEKIRHSLSHLMTMAVLEIYPEAGLGVGPVIEDGFYQDYDLPENISEDVLPKLEKKIKKLIAQKIDFIQSDASFEEALKFYKKDPYKTEMIKDLKEAGEKSVCFYDSGEFHNLCAGPHVKNASEINPKAFKLIKVAGAYWKGDEKNKMLQRVYGVAFKTEKELEDYLERIKQAEERDHRKLGQELELFMIDEDVGQGLILWLPKGAMIRKIVEDSALAEYLRRGYQLLQTPHIGTEKLFSISGHLDFYKDGMYAPFEVEEEKYYVKPMNCPFHIKIYQNSLKSYRDLPIRYTELGTVYRYERSGTLHGLMRVRGMTQDDGHIICRPDQLDDEIAEAIDLTKYILETFGFKDFRVALSVRDPKDKKKYLGKDTSWEHAEKALEKGVKKAGWQFEREEGEAVFYGPKVDVKVKDAIGREWQVSTIQVDFNLPSRFKVSYIDKDSKKKEPFMIHRALLGSLERFFGVLIEHYAGAFPLWLAPVQVQVVPVTSDFIKDAQQLAVELKEEGIRVWVDDLNETVGYKIRKGEKQKVPYMLVVGEKEAKGKTLNVRVRGQKKVETLDRKEFIERVVKEIKDKK